MSKSRNRFDSLPREDQSFILKLCANHSYEDLVGILRQPRGQGGLGLITSRSALCRFYTSRHLSDSQVALSQYAAAAQVWHERDSSAFFGALCAAIQARVLENVMNGKALADLERDFKLLRTAQRLYLADAKWRAAQPKEARASYDAYVAGCARQPEIDFVLAEECPEGSRERAAAEKALRSDLSGFDADLRQARQDQRKEEADRARLKSLAETYGLPFEDEIEEDSGGGFGPDSPAIPHIPPNSTSSPAPVPQPPAGPSRRSAAPAPNPSAKPVAPAAFEENVASAPAQPLPPRPSAHAQDRPARNTPCPCGSGKKYRRCCGARSCLLNELHDPGSPLAA